MDLRTLGFDEWFTERAAAVVGPEREPARVTAVDRDAFLVRTPAGELPSELAGRLRYATDSAADLPSVGDWVAVQGHGTGSPAIIHAVLPRRTFLRRKAPGRTVDFQMIAANIDTAFVVMACGFDFNPARLDRYLVTIAEGGIEPRVLITKTDLVSPGELEELLARVRQAAGPDRVLALSSLTGDGLAAFETLLVPGRTYCLLGSSGVGKTTLINRLVGREAFETKAVSGTGQGVHTTTRRHLLLLDGGAMLIDTPGMRELGLLGTADGLHAAFPEIGDLAAGCRFPDCTHTREPGCAVLLAVERGEIDGDRFRSYHKLRKETEFHDLSYVEKRQKDKSFGRFIKSVKKDLKK